MFLKSLRLAILCCGVAATSGGTAHAAVVDRSEYATTTQAATGGELTTKLGSVPLNFKGDDGVWRPVDTSLEPAGSGTVAATAVDGEVKLPATSGGRVVVEHDGREVSLKLVGASGGSRTVTDSTASFTGVLPGVSASYTATANGVKEVVKLGSAADRVLEYDLRGPSGWSASVAGGDVVLKDGAGHVQFRVAAPIAWDAAADPAYTNDLELAVSEVSDGRWLVTLTPDQAWLADPARVWPATIDPNVTWEDGTTRIQGATDCYVASNTQANYNFCDLAFMHTGYYNRAYRALMRWDVSSIPTDATVTEAKVKLFHPPTGPHLVAQHRLRTITSAWDASTVTWNKRNATTNWTTAGGDVSTDPAHISAPTGVQNTAWYEWTAPLTPVQGWIDGATANNGFQLSTDSGSPPTTAYTFISNEASPTATYPGTSSDRPILEITWEPAVPPQPTITVGGSFIDELPSAIAWDSEWSAVFNAESPADVITKASVWIDDDELLLAEVSNSNCTSGCETLNGVFDMSLASVEPGTHTATFVAEDSEGRTGSQTVTFERTSEPSFASLVDDWAGEYVDALDGSSAGVPASPLPSPVDAVTGEGDCETAVNTQDCRAEAAGWAASVQAWLETAPSPTELPELPRFPRPANDDRELHKAADTIDGMLLLAQAVVREPNAPQPVGVTFAEPLDENDAGLWASVNSLSGPSAVSGAEGPGRWKSMIQLVEPQPLTDTIDAFYDRAEASAERSVQAVLDEMAETPESWEDPWTPQDMQGNLDDAEAYLDLVEERGAVIGKIATTFSAARASTALATIASGDAEVTVVAPRLRRDAATIEAPAPPPTPAAVFGRGWFGDDDNCDVRGDNNVVPANHKGIVNPIYFAPARLKYDSVIDDEGFYFGNKEHRLRARWTVGESLAWMCAGTGNGKRNVELEARVTPEEGKWSTSWSTPAEQSEGRQSVWGNTNLPGDLHLDDIADGMQDEWNPKGWPKPEDPDRNPYDKSLYPDFALVAEDSRGVQYQQLYQSNFVTNSGETWIDGALSGGRVTYSAQSTTWVRDRLDGIYCNLGRLRQYASCMFSTNTVCYDKQPFDADPMRKVIPWSSIVESTENDPDTWAPDSTDGIQVTLPCVPKPQPAPGGYECSNIPDPTKCNEISDCQCIRS